jgi:hypothetical protein
VVLMKDWTEQLLRGLGVHHGDAGATDEDEPSRAWVESTAGDEEHAMRKPRTIVLAGDLSHQAAEAARFTEACGLVGIEVLTVSPYAVNGYAVAALGLGALEAENTADVHNFVPNYAQKTEAEVQLRARLSAEKGQQDAQNNDQGHHQ